jgi:hypothetical protein
MEFIYVRQLQPSLFGRVHNCMGEGMLTRALQGRGKI